MSDPTRWSDEHPALALLAEVDALEQTLSRAPDVTAVAEQRSLADRLLATAALLDGGLHALGRFHVEQEPGSGLTEVDLLRQEVEARSAQVSRLEQELAAARSETSELHRAWRDTMLQTDQAEQRLLDAGHHAVQAGAVLLDKSLVEQLRGLEDDSPDQGPLAADASLDPDEQQAEQAGRREFLRWMDGTAEAMSHWLGLMAEINAHLAEEDRQLVAADERINTTEFAAVCSTDPELEQEALASMAAWYRGEIDGRRVFRLAVAQMAEAL